MRCQVKDILEFVAPNVGDSGVCPTTDSGKEEIISALDMAQSAMMKRIDADGALWDWPVPTYDGCFALPADCESDRQIFVNGFTAVQRDQWYEGKLCWGQNYSGTCIPGLECIDQGEFAIPLPLPKVHGIRIALVAEVDGDAGKEVVVEVINQYGDRVKETITLVANQEPAIMESIAYDVTYVGKPETFGAVKLELHYDNGARYYHAKYGAKVRFGRFRRKRLPQRFCGCNLVVIKGKLRSYRITSVEDILAFEDRLAWSWGVTAISSLRQRDTAGYNDNLTLAINEIKRSMQDSDPPSVVAQAVFRSGFSSNPSQAGGRCKSWN